MSEIQMEVMPKSESPVFKGSADVEELAELVREAKGGKVVNLGPLTKKDFDRLRRGSISKLKPVKIRSRTVPTDDGMIFGSLWIDERVEEDDG